MNDTIRLALCGDILPADFYFDVGAGLGSHIARCGFETIAKAITFIKGDADLLIGNLECPVDSEFHRADEPRREFLAVPVFLDALKLAGIDVLSIANNHISQYGLERLDDTAHKVIGAGIVLTGYISQGASRQTLSRKKLHGRTTGFLAYSLVDDHFENNPRHYAHRPGMADLKEEVYEARQECDILVLLLHWGEEFVDRPSGAQIELAHDLIDIGVDLIVGSHPHVVQGIEVYRGKTIVYSLGNFIFNMPSVMCRSSMVVAVEVQGSGDQSYKTLPIWLDRLGRPTIPEESLRIKLSANHQRSHDYLNEPPFSIEDYTILVSNGLKRYRRATKLRFLQTIFQMPPQNTLRLVREFLDRRLDK